jgi:hypothetical protein
MKSKIGKKTAKPLCFVLRAFCIHSGSLVESNRCRSFNLLFFLLLSIEAPSDDVATIDDKKPKESQKPTTDNKFSEPYSVLLSYRQSNRVF